MSQNDGPRRPNGDQRSPKESQNGAKREVRDPPETVSAPIPLKNGRTSLLTTIYNTLATSAMSRMIHFGLLFLPPGIQKHEKSVPGNSPRNGEENRAPNASKTARVGSPGTPKILPKSLENHFRDCPGAVSPLFDVPGWSRRWAPPQNHQKTTTISTRLQVLPVLQVASLYMHHTDRKISQSAVGGPAAGGLGP